MDAGTVFWEERGEGAAATLGKFASSLSDLGKISIIILLLLVILLNFCLIFLKKSTSKSKIMIKNRFFGLSPTDC